MAAYNKFNQTIEDMMHKVHNFSADTLELALTAAANAPVATNSVLLDLTPITYTNLNARTLTTVTSEGSDGSYELVLADKTISASGGAANPFRYVVVFNQSSVTPTDALICWFDYGSDLTLQDGESLTVDFQSNGGPNGQLFTAS
jgi:hypothetical protein